MDLVTLADIRSAADRLSAVLRATPVTSSPSFSTMAGRAVLLKPEHLQRTGSFKPRGAYNLISRLPAGVAVVAASAGNHAQGVALAASLTGHASTVFMPTTAALPKVDATRGYGGDVRLEGETVDDAIVAALAWADGRDAVFVPPFDHRLIIAGQGTIGLELADEVPNVEVVVVPVGGGGLIAGVATALATSRPGVRVVGVQVADRAATMADGIAVRSPSDLTRAHIEAYVDSVVTVSEDEISQALLVLLERSKALVEPAGAAALAAILAGRVGGTGPALALLSGGNVDPAVLARMVDRGLTAAGRYLIVAAVLDDRPGALADFTAAVARLRLNVLSVEHHRAGLDLPVDEVEVLLTVETRDAGHRQEVVAALAAGGFTVRAVG